MSHQIKKLVLTILLLTFAGAAQAGETHSQLEILNQKMTSTLRRLANPEMRNSERIQLVSRHKALAEDSLREMIESGLANPDDLIQPHSALSRAFKNVDSLTVLAEIQVDAKTELASPESCGRARSLLTVSNLTSDVETVALKDTSIQVSQIVSLICGR